MPNRLLKEGIVDSEKINTLSAEAEVLFYRLLVVSDDLGRMDARPSMIKSKCFPIKDEVTLVEITAWLDELAQTKLIMPYTVNSKNYIQTMNWTQRQRSNARYPQPLDSDLTAFCAQPADNSKQLAASGLGLGLGLGLGKGKGKDLSAHAAQTKGTRLPENWVLPKAWGEWALSERPELTADDVRKMADTFKDHWIANANRAVGKKADWLATWRNWVRNQKIIKPNGKGSEAPWWSSNALIEAKGKELGIFAKPGESMNEFRGRIQSKLGN